MAQAKAQSRRSSQTESRIGAGAQVRGRILGEGDLAVEGAVEGAVWIGGHLTVESGGRVVSPRVDAEGVTVLGSLDGDIHASGPVKVSAGSRVRGNVSGESIAIELGAEFAGQIDCAFDLPPELSEPLERKGTARR